MEEEMEEEIQKVLHPPPKELALSVQKSLLFDGDYEMGHLDRVNTLLDLHSLKKKKPLIDHLVKSGYYDIPISDISWDLFALEAYTSARIDLSLIQKKLNSFVLEKSELEEEYQKLIPILNNLSQRQHIFEKNFRLSNGKLASYIPQYEKHYQVRLEQAIKAAKNLFAPKQYLESEDRLRTFYHMLKNLLYSGKIDLALNDAFYNSLWYLHSRGMALPRLAVLREMLVSMEKIRNRISKLIYEKEAWGKKYMEATEDQEEGLELLGKIKENIARIPQSIANFPDNKENFPFTSHIILDDGEAPKEIRNEAVEVYLKDAGIFGEMKVPTFQREKLLNYLNGEFFESLREYVGGPIIDGKRELGKYQNSEYIIDLTLEVEKQFILNYFFGFYIMGMVKWIYNNSRSGPPPIIILQVEVITQYSEDFMNIHFPENENPKPKEKSKRAKIKKLTFNIYPDGRVVYKSFVFAIVSDNPQPYRKGRKIYEYHYDESKNATREMIREEQFFMQPIHKITDALCLLNQWFFEFLVGEYGEGGTNYISRIFINRLGLDNSSYESLATYKITNNDKWLKNLGITLSDANFCVYESFLIAKNITPDIDFKHKSKKGFEYLNKNRYKKEIIEELVQKEDPELRRYILDGCLPKVLSFLCRRHKTQIKVFKYNEDGVLIFLEDGGFIETDVHHIRPDGERHLIWNIAERHVAPCAPSKIFKGRSIYMAPHYKNGKHGKKSLIDELEFYRRFNAEPILEKHYKAPEDNKYYQVLAIYPYEQNRFRTFTLEGIDLKSRRKNDQRILIYWDIETPYRKGSERERKDGSLVERYDFYPISVCFRIINYYWFMDSVISYLKELHNRLEKSKSDQVTQEILAVGDLLEYQEDTYFYGKDCMLQAVNWIIKFRNLQIFDYEDEETNVDYYRKADIRFFAHNSACFDIRFIHLHFILSGLIRSQDAKYIEKKGAIIHFKVHNIDFVDSAKMIDGKLSDIAKSFGVPEGKMVFPYKFMKPENLDYIGEIPGLEYWESKEDYERFLRENQGKVFNFKEELIKYNMQDVVVGSEIIQRYMDINNDSEKDLRGCITKASAALKWFLQASPCLRIESPPEKQYNFFKRAYFGGYTRCFTPSCDTRIQGGFLDYLDENSAFPAAMLQDFGFVFSPLDYGFQEVPKDFVFDNESFYEVLWTCTSSDPLTRSIFKIDIEGESYYVLNAREKEDAMVCSGFALNYAKSHFSFRVGLCFIANPQHKAPIFRNFILARYAERKAQKAIMKSREHLKDQEYYNANLRQEQIKLCINSLYGNCAKKIGEKYEILDAEAAKIRIQSFEDSEKSNKVFIEPINTSHYLCQNSPDCQNPECANSILYQIKRTPDFPKPSSGHFVHLAAAITWRAKAILWGAMRDIGFSKVLYCDTDSIIVHLENKDDLPFPKREPGDESPGLKISQDHLGDLKSEYPGGGYLFYGSGPKMYAYYPKDTPENRAMQKGLAPDEPVKPLMKMKGIKTSLVKEGDLLNILKGHFMKYTFGMMWHREVGGVYFNKGESRYVKFIKNKCVFQLTPEGEIDIQKPSFDLKDRQEALKVIAFYKKQDKLKKDLALLENKISIVQDQNLKNELLAIKKNLEDEIPKGEYQREKE